MINDEEELNNIICNLSTPLASWRNGLAEMMIRIVKECKYLNIHIYLNNHLKIDSKNFILIPCFSNLTLLRNSEQEFVFKIRN